MCLHLTQTKLSFMGTSLEKKELNRALFLLIKEYWPSGRREEVPSLEWGGREKPALVPFGTYTDIVLFYLNIFKWVVWGEHSGFLPAAIIYYIIKNTKHGWVLTFNNMISKPNLSSLQGSFTSPDTIFIQGHVFPARYSFQGALLLYQKAKHQQCHSAPN